MNQSNSNRRATVHDVARTAGVSLATVDRVLNKRPGVRPKTVQKVEDAVLKLGFQRDLAASLLARARDLQLQFLIPSGANDFMDSLAEAASSRITSSRAQRVHISLARLPLLNGPALAAALDQLTPERCDCAVIVATDDPEVVRAVNAATRRGIVVMTLVSDLPASWRQHFVGIDNIAAGRTAASLLGRFCPPGGKVAVVAGSMRLHDHFDRYQGFAQVMVEEFPDLGLLPPLEGQDDPNLTEQLIAHLCATHSDLVGIYNVGAGSAGLVRALTDADYPPSIRVIAHELSTATRLGLRAGVIDVVIDQNPLGEIDATIAAARALALNAQTLKTNKAIEIRIFLRDNLD